MKKALLILLLSASLTFAVSCDDNSAESKTPEDTTVAVSDTVTSADAENDGSADILTVEFEDGKTITLGKAIPDLGEPLDYAEATSCIHPGMDKIYTFDGFSVTTSPDANGNDLVSEISLISDAASFKNGIKIGCDKSVVTAAYGDEYTESFGAMNYTTDKGIITAVIDENSALFSFSIAIIQ